MVKLTEPTVFKMRTGKSETPMDKTARVVRQMADDEAALRQAKTDRLRNARLKAKADAGAVDAPGQS